MADYIVKDTELTSVANAIRTAGGTSSLLNFPNGFVSAVNNISGGGSSDFSTAEVTVINNTEDSRLSLHIPTVCEANQLGEGSPAMIYNYMVCPLGESTRKVRLYKGLAYCEGAGTPPGTTITVSGNITIENNAALITGDCTITIS